MVYRDKPQRNVTRLTSGSGGEKKSPYWSGNPPAEAARTVSGWGSHVQVPVVTDSDDPRGCFTPVAGGLQFNYPGTYEVEAVGTITGGVTDVRMGIAFYTEGDISPSTPAAGTNLGGSLIAVGAATGSWFLAKTTVVVKTAGAKVLLQDYVQTTTSHTCNIERLHAVKVSQGGPGPQGIQGIQGPVGPKGTRWGWTPVWAFGDSTDIEAHMYDGGMPVVGDVLICMNGFQIGALYEVTAVYPSGNVDVFDTGTNIRGPAGPRWGTVNVSFPGGAGATVSGVPVTFPDGGLPKGGDIVQNLHPDHLGDVYFIDTTVFGANSATLKKYTPVMNIRGATGPAGDALSHWPINSVYISFTNTNPAAYFGGTWSAVGTGQMLIGVDPGDAAMDAAGDTGGSKTVTLTAANLPQHTHAIDHNHPDTNTGTTGSGHTHTFGINYLSTTTTGGTALRVTDVNNQTGGTGTGATATTSTTGSGHTHNVPIASYAGTSGVGNSPISATPTPVNNLPPYLAVYMWRRTA